MQKIIRIRREMAEQEMNTTPKKKKKKKKSKCFVDMDRQVASLFLVFIMCTLLAHL